MLLQVAPGTETTISDCQRSMLLEIANQFGCHPEAYIQEVETCVFATLTPTGDTCTRLMRILDTKDIAMLAKYGSQIKHVTDLGDRIRIGMAKANNDGVRSP